MGERRPTDSELRLGRLESGEPDPDEGRGVLELFDDPELALDEDARHRRVAVRPSR